MYTRDQILKGLKDPNLIKPEFIRQWRKVERIIPYDVGIQGSYETGNVGDRALGEIFEKRISGWGYRTSIFSHKTDYSNAKYKILGGGGVLHDWYGTDHLKARLKYVCSGKHGFILGIGVPGFQTDRGKELIRRNLPQIDLITVRDEWSKHNLREVYDIDCAITACPTFCYENPEYENIRRTGVNFRPFFQEDNITENVLENYFDYDSIDITKAKNGYIENAQFICDQLERPIFIPFHKNDIRFARNFLDIEIAGDKLSVKDTLRKVSCVDKMVATRYHSLIFAAICRKDVLVIAYEPKVGELADRLGVPSYLPHVNIQVEFSPVSNVDLLANEAQENFNLLRTYLD